MRNWSLSRIRDGPAPSTLAGPTCEGPRDQMPLPCGPSRGQAHEAPRWCLGDSESISSQLGLSRCPSPPAGQRGRYGGDQDPPWGESALPPNSHGLPPAGPHGCMSIAVTTSHPCQHGLLSLETAPRALRVRAPRASPIPSPGVSVPSREDPCTRPPPCVLSSPRCTSHSLQEAVLREKTAQGPGPRGTPRTAGLSQRCWHG